MASFRLARSMQADMIELDVLLTKDGVPVVFHDTDVRKLTNGNGPVSDFRFTELQKLDAGSRFSKTFEGEKIPALEEVLEWLPDEMLLNIEIKPEAVSETGKNGIEQKVIQLVEAENLMERVLLSSFSYIAVKRFKEIHSKLRTGLLYEKSQSAGKTPSVLMEEYRADFFHCSSREMSRNWQRQLLDKQLPFMIYTINRKRSMKNWIHKGAKGLFTDKPDLLREVYSETSEI